MSLGDTTKGLRKMAKKSRKKRETGIFGGQERECLTPFGLLWINAPLVTTETSGSFSRPGHHWWYYQFSPEC